MMTSTGLNALIRQMTILELLVFVAENICVIYFTIRYQYILSCTPIKSSMSLDLGLAAASSTSYVLNKCGDLNISTRSCRLSFTVGPDSREGHTSLLQDDCLPRYYRMIYLVGEVTAS